MGNLCSQRVFLLYVFFLHTHIDFCDVCNKQVSFTKRLYWSRHINMIDQLRGPNPPKKGGWICTVG